MRRLWTLSSRATRQRLALSHTHQGDAQFIGRECSRAEVQTRDGEGEARRRLELEQAHRPLGLGLGVAATLAR